MGSVWTAREKAAPEKASSDPAKAGPPHVSRDTPSYSKRKERERLRQAKQSSLARDIGELPPPADPARRATGWGSLGHFLRTYFPNRFPLPWSEAHLKLIARLEQTIIEGGLSAFAMPRSYGKTTITEGAAIWAVVTGRRKFVVLVGATKGHADEMMDSIKAEFETNDLLAADFPEVCHPIRCLEGIPQRANGQTFQGERTRMRWAGGSSNLVVLPTIKGSLASSAIIVCRGITGRIRGAKFRRHDGTIARPDLAIIDDPQTLQSAHSPGQVRKRHNTITGDILGLAGPGAKIAAIMPCTVIAPNDLAAQFLDTEKHPEWHGERTKLLKRFPASEKLWAEYAEKRRSSFRRGGNGAEATSFYRRHRKAMDKGAEPTWPERWDEGEISAIQYAMNLKIDRPEIFDAEYQNDPPAPELDNLEAIPTADEIEARTNGRPRGIVPNWATRLTAYIDVQHKLLYYVVCAWADDFTGAVVDYGTWPDQGRDSFTYREAKKLLQPATSTKSVEAAVMAGLQALTGQLLSRNWEREGGTTLRIERCLIDASDGKVTKQVAEVCRNGPHATTLLPSTGRAWRAKDKPLHEYTAKPGERLGFHFQVITNRTHAVRQAVLDVNFWKSFVVERLAASPGDPGALTLFGAKGQSHQMLPAHCQSEFRQRITHEQSGRSVDEWQLKPGRPDNHLWDCLVGATAAAGIGGCQLAGSTIPRNQKKTKSPRKRVSPLNL